MHDIILTLLKNKLLFLILSRIGKTSIQYFQASKQYLKASILLQIRQQFIWDEVPKRTEGFANTACPTCQSCAGVQVDIQTRQASPWVPATLSMFLSH